MPTGLTLAQLRNAIRGMVSQSALTIGDAELTLLINQGMERVNHSHDWAGLQAETDISYLAASDGLALPADFISEFAVWQIDAANGDAGLRMHPLPRIDRRVWLERGIAPQVLQGFPRPSLTGLFYYVWNKKLWVVPDPAATVVVRVHYINRLNELVNDGDTNFFTVNYPALIKWSAMVELYSFLYENERADHSERVFNRYLQAVIQTDTAGRWRGGWQHSIGGSQIGQPISAPPLPTTPGGA